VLPVRIGVTVFATDQTIHPATLARAVEERGYDSLWFPEHTHLPVRRSEPPGLVTGVRLEDYRRSLDPFIALAAASSVTERIRLGTGVALVAQHDPIVLAKALATLDHVSDGRVVLGVGSGWNKEEAEDHGVDGARRRERMLEHLHCMQTIWRDDEASFAGEHVSFEPAYSWPKPAQRPDGPSGPAAVPVLFGGAAGPKLFAAIAEAGHGWLPIGGAGMAAELASLREVVAEAGRDPAQLEVVPFGTIPSAGKLERYREVGATEVVLRIPNGDDLSILRTLDEYTQFLVP
jgi:probable F420-dependent oxidoreductase